MTFQPGTINLQRNKKRPGFAGYFALALASLCQLLTPPVFSAETIGVGVVNPVGPASAGAMRRVGSTASNRGKSTSARRPKATRYRIRAGKRSAKAVSGKKRSLKKVVKRGPVARPQDLAQKLSQHELAPGVVHRVHRGSLTINIIDIDLDRAPVKVKPVMANHSFGSLSEVRSQSGKVNAIAAINANYFKKDGTPLGTLIADGEWIAGPLYDRTSLGVASDGLIHIDRLNLHGTLETSNPNVASMWVNNINQPRRSGCKLMVYTRRWGPQMKMAYHGALVSVDAQGRVIDKSTQTLAIPYGGFVLSDSKGSQIEKLERGDLVHLNWHTKPYHWADIEQAVSGGPHLVKGGKLYLDLKDEKFRKSWTGSQIHARTAVGLTANKHLLMVTVEGPHTMWDLAKMLHKMGAVEALNLDGGGSTTMVVQGKTVTRNKNVHQRRVSCSLAVLPLTNNRNGSNNSSETNNSRRTYIPKGDIVEFNPLLSSGETASVFPEPLGDIFIDSLNVSSPADSNNLIGQAEGLLPQTIDFDKSDTYSKARTRQKKGQKKGWLQRFKPSF